MPKGKDTSQDIRRQVWSGMFQPVAGGGVYAVTRAGKAQRAQTRTYNQRSSDWGKWNDQQPYPGTPDTDPGKYASWSTFAEPEVGPGTKGPAAKATGRI